MFTLSPYSRQFERYLELDIVNKGTKTKTEREGEGEGEVGRTHRQFLAEFTLASSLRHFSHRRMPPSPRKAAVRCLQFLVGCNGGFHFNLVHRARGPGELRTSPRTPTTSQV